MVRCVEHGNAKTAATSALFDALLEQGQCGLDEEVRVNAEGTREVEVFSMLDIMSAGGGVRRRDDPQWN